MICELCSKEVNQRTSFDGKWLCNYCLGANYPKWASMENEKTKRIKAINKDLLEACQEAENYLQYNHGQGNKAFEKCKQAITKAKGEK